MFNTAQAVSADSIKENKATICNVKRPHFRIANMAKERRRPKPCFVHHLKIIDTFIKTSKSILKRVV